MCNSPGKSTIHGESFDSGKYTFSETFIEKLWIERAIIPSEQLSHEHSKTASRFYILQFYFIACEWSWNWRQYAWLDWSFRKLYVSWFQSPSNFLEKV